MKRSIYILVLVGILVSIVFSACAPKPAPLPSPTAPAPVATPATAPLVKPVPETDSWAQVLSAAHKEGVVNVYTWVLAGDAGNVVSKAFKDKYGIELRLVTGIGPTLIERIKTELAAKKYVADTMDFATAQLAIAKDEGLTVPVGELPILAERDVWLVFPPLDLEKHIVGMGTGIIAPYVNTTMVKPGEEPRSYKDLLQPKWKGKLVAQDTNVGPLLNRLYAVMVPAKLLDEDFFRGLGRQGIRMVPTARDADAVVVRGELPIIVPGSSLSMGPLVKEGAPVKPLDMEEGTINSVGPGIAMVKNAPHPNAARVFINWVLSAEGQRVLHEVRASTPIRKDVPDFVPAGARLTPRKFLVADMKVDVEAARLAREKVIARLIGLEK